MSSIDIWIATNVFANRSGLRILQSQSAGLANQLGWPIRWAGQSAGLANPLGWPIHSLEGMGKFEHAGVELS